MMQKLRARPRSRIPSAHCSAPILLAFTLSLPFAAAPELSAQGFPDRDAGDREARREILAFLNDPGTLRLTGDARVPAGARLEGKVAVLGGSLALNGTIIGDLLVVNGDLEVGPGARVDGDARIVGGAVRGGDGIPWLGGALTLDPAPLRYRIRGGRVEDATDPSEIPVLIQADFGAFVLRPVAHGAGAYNRVEGLPVRLGGLFETRSRNPFIFEATAIWRSASGLELERDQIGHHFRVEQALGGSEQARLGATLHRRIVPIESRGLSSLEASLSTFFLRRDLRDHHEEDGWSVFVEGTPVEIPVRTRIEYREETHRSVPVRDPWTLGSAEDRSWRPQPLVAEGALRTLLVGITLDTRDDPIDPSHGWWIDGSLRRRVGGMPELPADRIPDASPYELATEGRVDLRRYSRLGPEARLNTRLFLSGPLNRVPLPPQYQRTLGGEGSLPGHPRFAIDCGARATLLPGTGGMTPDDGSDEETVAPAWPAYGCDGVALARVEFQGRLPFAWHAGDQTEAWEIGSLLSLRPAWSLFLGAGKGWSYAEEGSTDARVPSPLRVDMGVGVFVGPLGVYWAWPLNERERGLNFFVRLTHLL